MNNKLLIAMTDVVVPLPLPLSAILILVIGQSLLGHIQL